MTTAEEIRNLIPEKVYNMYRMDAGETALHIMYPAFIGIQYDEKFDVTVRNSYITIRNKKVSIDLYVDYQDMTITVYD